MKKYKRLYI